MSSRTRVAVVAEVASFGGVNRFLEYLVSSLRGLGLEVELYCDRPAFAVPGPSTVKLVPDLQSRSGKFASSLTLLRESFWAATNLHSYSVIFYVVATPGKWLGCGALPGAKHIYWCHSSNSKDPGRRPLRWAAQGLHFLKRTKFVAPTHSARLDLNRIFADLNLFEFVVPCPASLQASEKAPVVPLQKPYVLTAGHLEAIKDPFKWVRIARRVIDRFPNITFVWVGDGSLKASLLREISTGPHPDKICVLPPQSSYADIVKGAEMYLCTSAYESQGLAPLEAAHLGVPPIVPRIGGLEEVFSGWSLSYPPQDEKLAEELIAQLLQNQSLRNSKAAAARTYVNSLAFEQKFFESLRSFVGIQ